MLFVLCNTTINTSLDSTRNPLSKVASYYSAIVSPGWLDLLMLIFDVLLTVRLSITLVNDQLDPQFFYFVIRLLKSSTCFEQRRAHHQEVKLY